MSDPPANASSSLTSTTTAASTRVSQDTRPANSRVLARKSPPPPKLRLDGWSPLISTTTTNTSTNAAHNPSHAFVFTSSRTLRSLHNCPGSSDEPTRPLPATDPIQPNSPPPVHASLSPPSSPSTSSRSLKRPTLSSAQLARHSSGAVDARSIVSPNMRAAGFVPLYNQQSDASTSPTPNPSVVPTPINPPRFPPIVFVNPTNVAHASMWEYQRTLSYGLATEYPAGLGFDPEPAAYRSQRPGTQSVTRESPGTRDIIATSTSGTSTVPSTSSSGLFSRMNSPKSSMSSFELSPDGASDAHRPIHERLRTMTIRDSPLDGYPFPETPTVSRSRSKDTPDTVKKSPSISSSTASGSITPLAASPLSSPASPPASLATSPGSGSTPSGRGSLSPVPSRPQSGRTRSGHQLSITQLYEVSPVGWFAHSNLVAPQSSDSGGSSGVRGTRKARGAGSKVVGGSDEMKAQATAAALEIERAVEVMFEAESGGKGVAKEVQEEEEDFIAKEKRQEKHRGREKDRARDKEKKRDRRRHEDKTSTKSHSSSSPTSSTPSPGRKGKGRAHHKPKDRTRSTKEKVLGSSYPTTFTTSFATFGHSGGRVPARPHMLGDPDPALDRERERDAGAFAKDDVFARRERDRQHARQTEHSHGKHRKHAATAELSTGPLTMAYDAGRGRGIGRGQHPGMRGRSVSSLFSTFSETGTMVDSVAEEPLETSH